MFAEHLSNVFTPFQSNLNTPEEEIHEFLESPYQLLPSTESFKLNELKEAINKDVSVIKALGYDLISGKILKELADVTIKQIWYEFNAIIRAGHFPAKSKISQVNLILKLGKKPQAASSYRLISLLLVLSKILEKRFLKRMSRFVPSHQFGFIKHHSDIQQIGSLL